MTEPRSLPELVAARAAGGLRDEEFLEGVTFGALGSRNDTPPELAFVHEPGPWLAPCARGTAILPQLSLLIAARATARALALHELDRIRVDGPWSSLRLRVGGLVAALYAGARLATDGANIVVTETSVTIDGETLAVRGWPETAGVALLGGRPLERIEVVERGGELLVRGPAMMAGYAGDPATTAAAFAGGWFHTGEEA